MTDRQRRRAERRPYSTTTFLSALAIACMVAGLCQPAPAQSEKAKDEKSADAASTPVFGGQAKKKNAPDPKAGPSYAGDAKAGDWSEEEYRALEATKPASLREEKPAGDEKLDRVENRENQAGAYDLLTLLGLPKRDIVLESAEKTSAIVEARAKVSGPFKGAGKASKAFAIDLSPQEAAKKSSDSGLGGEFKIVSSDFLEVDLDGQRVFGTKRSRITIGRYEITADRVSIDVSIREAHAFGDVRMKDLEGALEIEAESLTFNFRDFIGQAQKVKGRQEQFYFFNDDLEPLPNYRQLNQRDLLLWNASVTGNDWTIPQYHVRGREIVFQRDERVWIMHAILYVRGWPIAYIPAYTRSLKEKSSWQFYLGRDNDDPHPLGYFGSLQYDYYYKYLEPNPLKDGEYLRRSFARWTPTIYYFEPAQGVGLEGRYDYEYGKHKGELFSFFTPEDDERDLEGGDQPDVPVNGEGVPLIELAPGDDEEDNSGNRFAIDLKHRSEIANDLDLFLDVDWVSDSEVYFDFFDKFFEEERGRLGERSAEASLTWRRDSFLARLKVEETQRLTRNKITNPVEPGDDDADFDENPNNAQGFFLGVTPAPGDLGAEIEPLDFVLDDEPLQDGDQQINNRRFRTVSRRLPEFRLATNRIKLSNTPVYWTLDLRAFNNLDKGLNSFKDEDDTQVTGFDLYNSLTYTWNITDSFSWQHRLGVGVGHADREDDTWLIFDSELRPRATFLGEPREIRFPATLNNVTFLDESTILVGRNEVSLEDVSDNFVYADYNALLTKRFSQELTAKLDYIFREGTDDSLFETYERLGLRQARRDVFHYRQRIHRIGGSLEWNGQYPRIAASLTGGANLQSEDDIYANEIREYAAANLSWTSVDEAWKLSSSASWTNVQIRDPSDPFAFEQSGVAFLGQVDYFPTHGLYWGQVRGSYVETLDEDPLQREREAQLALDPNLGDDEFEVDDDLTRVVVDSVFGFKAGPKYELELVSRWDDDEEDFDQISLFILRDLYDAVAIAELSWDLVDQFDDDDGIVDDPNGDRARQVRDNDEREFDINFGFGFRLPNTERFAGSGGGSNLTTLRRRPSEFELGG